jgi:flagellar protein FlbD
MIYPARLTEGFAFPHLIGAGCGDLRGFFFRRKLASPARRGLLSSRPAADEEAERKCPMIELTRLNGSRLSINCDLIKYVDSAPDTVLTLVTGEKLVVLEPRGEVTRKTMEFRASVLRSAWPDAETALAAKRSRDVQELASDLERSTS